MKFSPWQDQPGMPNYVGDVEVHTQDDALHVVVFDTASAREIKPARLFRMRFINPPAVPQTGWV